MTAEHVPPTLGDRVAARRKALGWTLDRVAKAAGISRTYAWEIEQGSEPSVGIAVRLADALGVSLEWLARGREGDEPRVDYRLARQKLAELAALLSPPEGEGAS